MNFRRITDLENGLGYLKCINRPFLNCGLDKNLIAKISVCYLRGPVAETSLGWLRTARCRCVAALILVSANLRGRIFGGICQHFTDPEMGKINVICWRF